MTGLQVCYVASPLCRRLCVTRLLWVRKKSIHRSAEVIDILMSQFLFYGDSRPLLFALK